jgi:hypothetical protein
MFSAPVYSFTRPADTNSTTVGSVVPMTWGVDRHGGRGKIVGGRIFKSAATTTAAKFNVHLFARAPTPTNGDNGSYAVATVAYWIGTLQFDMTTAAELAAGVDLAQTVTLTSPGITFDTNTHGAAAGTTQGPPMAIYGLMEANGGYAPASGETFKVTLHIEG